MNKIWNKHFYWIGGHHKNTPADILKETNICSSGSAGYVCYGNLLLKLILLDFTNYSVIQIKNSSFHSSVTFTFRDQVKTLTTSEISKKIKLYYDPIGLYKVETAENGVVIDNLNYNFRTGIFNDGIVIRFDGALVNDLILDGCNIFDIEQGKIIQGECLAPTNP